MLNLENLHVAAVKKKRDCLGLNTKSLKINYKMAFDYLGHIFYLQGDLQDKSVNLLFRLRVTLLDEK